MEKSKNLAKWIAYLSIILSIVNVIMIFSLDYARVNAGVLEDSFSLVFINIFTGEGFTSKLFGTLGAEELGVESYDSANLEKLLLVLFLIGCVLLLIFAVKLLRNTNESLHTQLRSNTLTGIYCGAICACVGVGVLYYIVYSAQQEVEKTVGFFNMLLGITIETDALLIAGLNAAAAVVLLILGKSYNNTLRDEIAATTTKD